MKNKIIIEDLNYIKNNMSDEEKRKFNNSTILITGCAGFLGYYITNFFVKFSKELKIKLIITLDNFKLGKPKWLETLAEDNEEIIKLYNFDITKGQLNDIEYAQQADYIIHMASIASPTFYRKYPIETVDANVWGLRKLLDFYMNKSIKGLLFFSSSEVYGNPLSEFIPTSEGYLGNVSSIGPRACYDEAKRFGETLCYLYNRQYNVPISIVRPFNNYGPGMKLNDGRIPADFAKAVLENKDLIIYSDGTPTRTFCYISDAVLGYIKALVYGKFDYFNIGIEQPEISIKELAEIYRELAKSIFGYTGEIRLSNSEDKEYLTHNPARRCPNIHKAKTILEYYPEISVKDGVKRFLEYIKLNESGDVH